MLGGLRGWWGLVLRGDIGQEGAWMCAFSPALDSFLRCTRCHKQGDCKCPARIFPHHVFEAPRTEGGMEQRSAA